MNNIYLREATINDELLVFEWRNIDSLESNFTRTSAMV
jgi:hypothetical protein